MLQSECRPFASVYRLALTGIPVNTLAYHPCTPSERWANMNRLGARQLSVNESHRFFSGERESYARPIKTIGTHTVVCEPRAMLSKAQVDWKVRKESCALTQTDVLNR